MIKCTNRCLDETLALSPFQLGLALSQRKPHASHRTRKHANLRVDGALTTRAI